MGIRPALALLAACSCAEEAPDPHTGPPSEHMSDTTTRTECAAPPVPRPFTTIRGHSTAEDFDFDGEGFVGSVWGDDLVGRDGKGTLRIISPNVSPRATGTRVLSTGDWVVADADVGRLLRIDEATGAKVTIAGNLDIPNGVEVDGLDWVYVSDQEAGRVLQVHAYDETQVLVADGLTTPNGVVLSPDGLTLYIASWSGGVIYAVQRAGETLWSHPRPLYVHAGEAYYDGIAVDSCGHIYWTQYDQGQVWRMEADGSNRVLAAQLPSYWIPNLRWGNDRGSWANDRLYVADRERGRLFVLDVGLPGPTHLLSPVRQRRRPLTGAAPARRQVWPRSNESSGTQTKPAL